MNSIKTGKYCHKFSGFIIHWAERLMTLMGMVTVVCELYIPLCLHREERILLIA